MDVESRLDRALERGGEAVQPDVPGALLEVAAGPGDSTTRRRAGVGRGRRRRRAGRRSVRRSALRAPTRPGPGQPRPRDRDVGRVSLTVVREATARVPGSAQAAERRRRPPRPGLRHRHVPTGRRAEARPRASSAPGAAAANGAGRVPARRRAVDRRRTPTGRVYVSDTGNFRIQVFSASGHVRAVHRRVRQRARPVHLALRPRRRRRRQRLRRRRQGADAREAARRTGHQSGGAAGSARPTRGCRVTSTSRCSTPRAGSSPVNDDRAW